MFTFEILSFCKAKQMDPELILAATGIIFALFAFAIISYFRTQRKKKEADKLADEITEKADQLDKAEPNDEYKIPYFVAANLGSRSSLYRVYIAKDALLFLRIGQEFVGINDEVIRNNDKLSALQITLKLYKKFVAVAGAALSVVSIIMLAVFIGRGRGKAVGPLDGIILPVALIGFFIVLGFVCIPLIIRSIMQRCERFDSMSLEQLRKSALTEDDSFTVNVENSSEVNFQPRKSDQGDSTTLKFRHKPTGKWKIKIDRDINIQLAVRSFQHIFGKKNVVVDSSVQEVADDTDD
jgi:hypothetical protein